jgi:hypothetical protein
MLAMATLWLDAVLSVKVIHRIEARAQTARWDDNVNVVRKFLFSPRCSELAFIAGHRS